MLSQGYDVGVVVVFTGMFYFVFYTILDQIIDVAVHIVKPTVVVDGETIRVKELRSVTNPLRVFVVGFTLSLNATGALFGGSPQRTPLTVQMALVVCSFQALHLCTERFVFTGSVASP